MSLRRNVLIAAGIVLCLSWPVWAQTTQSRLPTGVTSTNNWTSSTGGTKYGDIDDDIGAPDDATTYIYTGTNSVGQGFTFSAFDINASAISNVKVVFRGQRTAAGDCTIQPYIRVGGTSYSSASKAMTTSWADYDSGTSWNNNPKTTSAWTEADVEGTGANPLQQFLFYSGGVIAGEELQITQAYIVVTYTEATSGTSKQILLLGVGD